MPRFVFTPTEESLITAALLREAAARNLTDGGALIAAANTTQAEFRSLVQNQLNQMKATNTSLLAAADADNTARKAALTSANSAIDSALAKL